MASASASIAPSSMSSTVLCSSRHHGAVGARRSLAENGGMPKLPLPLPDEQPVAVNALRNKRSAIAGEIEMHSREIDRLRGELIHLDAVLRLFDPELNPEDIHALRRHPRRTEWFARGEVTQRLYEALREQGEISPRQVAHAAIDAKGIAAHDNMTKRDIVHRFVNVMYGLTRRGLAEKIGHGPGARWKIAAREPDLI